MLSYKYSLLYFVILSFIFTSSSSLSPLFSHFILNACLQCIIFLLTAQIPAFLTGRMSYVDIAWPCGLFAIGCQTILFYLFPSSFPSFISSHSSSDRVLLISLIYLFIGGRMFFGGLYLWWKGKFQTEYPRYQYQIIQWNQQYGGENNYNKTVVQQLEIFVQCIANSIFLNLPSLIITHSPSFSLSFSSGERIAIGLWTASFLFESIADTQKTNWLIKNKKLKANNNNNNSHSNNHINGNGKHDNNNNDNKPIDNNNSTNKIPTVCRDGLWSLCRHPNYFGEWMVWNSLALLSIFSLYQFYQNGPSIHLGQSFVVYFGISSSFAIVISTVLIGYGVIMISYLMYGCLVYYTGAAPSEYYSVQKRAEYREYQQSTNMFFPDIFGWRSSGKKNKDY